MTDEKLKTAPMCLALMEKLEDVWAAAIPEVCYTEATQDVIKALQKDGQYIVFAAPTGYRFGNKKALAIGEFYPAFSCIDDSATPIPADGCAGIYARVLEPLTGGVE
jgi:hypothetical protein